MATVESGADTQSRYERLEGRLELIAVILLGLAATVTAWAAYQGGQFDGKMVTAFTEANLVLNDANLSETEVTQTYIEDELIFMQWVAANYEGDREFATYLRERLMSERLSSAITSWESEGSQYDTPFVDQNPFYVIESYTKADELVTVAQTWFAAGQDANQTGGKYNVIGVLLAAALFVLGIATSFKVLLVRMGLIAIGTAIFVGSTLWMLTLPIAS